MIAKRDNISLNEAHIIVEDTAMEINAAIVRGDSYDEVMDILRDFLNLEPDYIDLFIIWGIAAWKILHKYIIDLYDKYNSADKVAARYTFILNDR